MSELQNTMRESVEIMRMLRVEMRTGLRDLLPMLQAMDQRLEKYDVAKGHGWRTQSVDTHLIHARGHLDRAIAEFHDYAVMTKELSGAALRVGFALTCLVLRRGFRVQGSLSALRSDGSRAGV